MEKSKHTLGPWDFRKFRGGDGKWYASIYARHLRLAVCDIPPERSIAVEAEANIRLFAAAPDLLAACKAMTELPRGAFYAGREGPEELAAWRKCLTAIAKAEGR